MIFSLFILEITMAAIEKQLVRMRCLFFVVVMGWAPSVLANGELVKTIAKIKPAIVGIGTYHPTRSPRLKLRGTGFAILNGRHIVTNKHVIPHSLDSTSRERLVVFVGTGNKPEYRQAEVIASSKQHDLAVLKISGSALPTFRLGNSKLISEGRDIAFTGFPIGAVLGLYPVTHTGTVASITPIAIPAVSAKQLNLASLKRLRNPYMVYQLDATAYPGNSGSPMYDPRTGQVYGIINKVFVKQSKESVLSNPSAITYAIPVKYLNKLLSQLPKK